MDETSSLILIIIAIFHHFFFVSDERIEQGRNRSIKSTGKFTYGHRHDLRTSAFCSIYDAVSLHKKKIYLSRIIYVLNDSLSRIIGVICEKNCFLSCSINRRGIKLQGTAFFFCNSQYITIKFALKEAFLALNKFAKLGGESR